MFSKSAIKGYRPLWSLLNYSFSNVSLNTIRTFGVFGVVNYPLFYIFWNSIPGEEYNSKSFRMVACVLCLFLTLVDYWPQRLKPFIKIYWYVSILYCLPFFGAYLFLENSISNTWLTNNLLAIFLLGMITNKLSFLVILLTGVITGWFAHYCMEGPTLLPFNFIEGPFVNYIWAIVIVMIFGKTPYVAK